MKIPSRREFQFAIKYCFITRQTCVDSFEPKGDTKVRYLCKHCQLAWNKKNEGP